MAIHAAKNIILFEELFDDLSFAQRLAIMDAICREYGDYDKMPTGAIVATGILSNVQPTEVLRENISLIEKACGDYSDNRFGWMIKNVERFTKPVCLINRTLGVSGATDSSTTSTISSTVKSSCEYSGSVLRSTIEDDKSKITP